MGYRRLELRGHTQQDVRAACVAALWCVCVCVCARADAHAQTSARVRSEPVQLIRHHFLVVLRQQAPVVSLVVKCARMLQGGEHMHINSKRRAEFTVILLEAPSPCTPHAHKVQSLQAAADVAWCSKRT